MDEEFLDYDSPEEETTTEDEVESTTDEETEVDKEEFFDSDPVFSFLREKYASSVTFYDNEEQNWKIDFYRQFTQSLPVERLKGAHGFKSQGAFVDALDDLFRENIFADELREYGDNLFYSIYWTPEVVVFNLYDKYQYKTVTISLDDVSGSMEWSGEEAERSGLDFSVLFKTLTTDPATEEFNQDIALSFINVLEALSLREFSTFMKFFSKKRSAKSATYLQN